MSECHLNSIIIECYSAHNWMQNTHAELWIMHMLRQRISVAPTSGQVLLEVVGQYPSSQTEIDSRYGVFSGGAAGVATNLMNWQGRT
jgi:hypothetical protein